MVYGKEEKVLCQKNSRAILTYIKKNMELRYFRDIDGREVDFVVSEEMKPVMFVECKWNDAPIARGLRGGKGDLFMVHFAHATFRSPAWPEYIP